MTLINGSLHIDTSEAVARMRTLQRCLSFQQAEKLEIRTIQRTGTKVKKIVGDEVPKDYALKSNVVKKDVKRKQIRYGTNGNVVECCIPVQGVKHMIGGKTVGATGGRRGWHGIRKGSSYPVYAKILRAKMSKLPQTMGEFGGHPPFRNFAATKLHMGAFTRKEEAEGYRAPDNLPIQRLTALAVPQMVANQSAEKIQDQIVTQMVTIVEEEYDKLIEQCR